MPVSGTLVTPELVTRYAYDVDGNAEYIGCHSSVDAATDDENWHITKLTYAADKLTAKQGPLVGAWDDRAILGW